MNTNKRIILIVVAVALIAGVVLGVVAWMFDSEQARLRNSPHPVMVSVDAPGYLGEDTLIPVVVSGTAIDGEQVEGVFFVNAAGEGVSLKKGTYSVRVAASPLTADGLLFGFPADAIGFSIPEDLDSEQSFDARALVTLKLTKLTALDETDEAIEQAYQYAVEDQNQASLAENYRAIALQKHADAVKAENERKAKETIAAKTKAGRYYTCPYYTIDLPDSLDSSWKIEVESEGLTFPYTNPDGKRFGGGYSASIVNRNNVTQHAEVAVWTTNWGPEGDLYAEDLGLVASDLKVSIDSGVDYSSNETWDNGYERAKNNVNLIRKYVTIKN